MVLHVIVKEKRTTVTISDFLVNMLAVKLVGRLAKDSIIDVVYWFQLKIDSDPDKYCHRVSQQLQEEALIALCQKSIYHRYLIKLAQDKG